MGAINQNVDLTQKLTDVSSEVYVIAESEGLESSQSNKYSYGKGILSYDQLPNGNYTCTGIRNFDGKAISIPSTHKDGDVEEIANNAFINLPTLVTVTLPSTIKRIGKSAFAFCPELASINIPNGVVSIGTRAFQSCPSLLSIAIPASVTELGDHVFYSCTGLRSVTLGEGIVDLPSDLFNNCNTLVSVTIPGTVESIGERTFMYCQGLSNISIPSSVKYIGTDAFKRCDSLEDAYFRNPYGWFRSNLSTIPEKLIDGQNCYRVRTPGASALVGEYSCPFLFKVDAVPAPTIKVVDGILYITEESGLAETFRIFINDLEVDQVSTGAQHTIEGGLWVADTTPLLPSTELRLDFSYTDTDGVAQNSGTIASPTGIYYIFANGEIVQAYDPGTGWFVDTMRSISLPEDVTASEDFYNWFTTYYTRQQ